MFIVSLIFKILPQNLLSFVTGVLASWEWPPAIQVHLNRLFVTVFSINTEEADKPLDEYKSIQEVFTRKLNQDARTCHGEFCSPCDGTIRSSGPLVGKEKAVVAKGFEYSVDSLVFGNKYQSEPKVDFESWAITVYLAPRNYHRVHSPVEGTLTRILYVPGELWPVNDPFLGCVPNVFLRNERMIFTIEGKGGATLRLVMVGSFNVGKMNASVVPDFFSNGKDRLLGTQDLNIFEGKKKLAQGEELGTFMLGSTVVMILDKQAAEAYNIARIEQCVPTKLGKSLQASH